MAEQPWWPRTVELGDAAAVSAGEIARAALFLASDNSFVTGANFLVDGGITAVYVTPDERVAAPFSRSRERVGVIATGNRRWVWEVHRAVYESAPSWARNAAGEKTGISSARLSRWPSPDTRTAPLAAASAIR